MCGPMACCDVVHKLEYFQALQMEIVVVLLHVGVFVIGVPTLDVLIVVSGAILDVLICISPDSIVFHFAPTRGGNM